MRWMVRAAMAAAVGLLGLMAAPAAALAGDVECLYRAMPADGLAKIGEAFPELEGAQMVRILGGPDTLTRAMGACSVQEAGREEAARALIGRIMVGAALVRLETDYGFGAAEIDAAWSAEPAADRQAFCDVAGGLKTSGDGEERMLGRVIKRLPPGGGERQRKLTAFYIVGGCMQRFGAARF